MPRRARALKRQTPPDSKYGNVTVAILIKKMMSDGMKATAERVVYDAMDLVNKQIENGAAGGSGASAEERYTGCYK